MAVTLAYADSPHGEHTPLVGVLEVDLPEEWANPHGGGLREPGTVTVRYERTPARFATVLQIFARREDLHWRATFDGLGTASFVGAITRPGGYHPAAVGEVVIRVSGPPRFDRT